MPSSHLILCHPLLLLPPIFPSIRVFSNELAFCIRLPKYWSFSITPSNEYSESSPATQFESINSLALTLLYGPAFTTLHDYWKNHSFDWRLSAKWYLCFLNMLSRFVTAFLPRSKSLLILWLQSPSTVILEPKKIKSVTPSIVFPSICHEVMGLDGRILVFWMLSFKPVCSLSSFTFIKRLFSSSSLSAIRVVSSAYLRLLIFLPEVLIQLELHPICTSTSSLSSSYLQFLTFLLLIATFPWVKPEDT